MVHPTRAQACAVTELDAIADPDCPMFDVWHVHDDNAQYLFLSLHQYAVTFHPNSNDFLGFPNSTDTTFAVCIRRLEITSTVLFRYIKRAIISCPPVWA